MSAPQSRRVLAQIGWDWSIVMNLARFELADLDSVPGFGRQTFWQGTGPFQMAGEMMRWGNKLDEVRTVLAAHPRRLMEHYEDDPALEDALRRLSDVAVREQVLQQHPDQFWVYRKKLKKRLVDQPRTIIEPVKGEGLQQRMHPDDQRRLDYFEALGYAAQQNPCPLGALRRVEHFAAPFDPLVSYFMHGELARLYQRSQPPQPEQELLHWLHSLYYGSHQERTVRSIHRSLQLLAEADLSFTAAERYDHTNALLELMELRWQMRKGKQDLSQSVLLIDIKDTLASCEVAFAALRKQGTEAGLPAAQTEIRIADLERTMIRPLRSYRTELLATASRLPLPGSTPQPKSESSESKVPIDELLTPEEAEFFVN